MASPTRPPFLAPEATRKDALDKSCLSEQQRESLSRVIVQILEELDGETTAQIFGRSIAAKHAFRAFVNKVVVDTGLGVRYWGRKKSAGLVWRTGVEHEGHSDNDKITSIVGTLIRRSNDNRKKAKKGRESRARDKEHRKEANGAVLKETAAGETASETAKPSPLRYPSPALEPSTGSKLTRETSSAEQPPSPTPLSASPKAWAPPLRTPPDHPAFLEDLRQRISTLSSFLASSSTHRRRISHHKNSMQCDLEDVTAKLTLEQEASSQARCELNKSCAEVERLTKMLKRMEEENGRLRRCIALLSSTSEDKIPSRYQSRACSTSPQRVPMGGLDEPPRRASEDKHQSASRGRTVRRRDDEVKEGDFEREEEKSIYMVD